MIKIAKQIKRDLSVYAAVGTIPMSKQEMEFVSGYLGREGVPFQVSPYTNTVIETRQLETTITVSYRKEIIGYEFLKLNNNNV